MKSMRTNIRDAQALRPAYRGQRSEIMADTVPLKHPKCPSCAGTRNKGRKWIKVLETARLDVHTLKVADAHRLRPYADITPKKLAKRIRFPPGALQAA